MAKRQRASERQRHSSQFVPICEPFISSRKFWRIETNYNAQCAQELQRNSSKFVPICVPFYILTQILKNWDEWQSDSVHQSDSVIRPNSSQSASHLYPHANFEELRRMAKRHMHQSASAILLNSSQSACHLSFSRKFWGIETNCKATHAPKRQRYSSKFVPICVPFFILSQILKNWDELQCTMCTRATALFF